MTSDDDRRYPLDITGDDLNRGFDAVKDLLKKQSSQRRAELESRALRAELAFDAYALGRAYLERDQLGRARNWLEIAARHGVPGAQQALDGLEERHQVGNGDGRAGHPVTGSPAGSTRGGPFPRFRPVRDPAGVLEGAGHCSDAVAQPIAADRWQAAQVVAAARHEAAVLLASARQKAEEVVADARSEARTLLAPAQGWVAAYSSGRREATGNLAAATVQTSYATGPGGRVLAVVGHDASPSAAPWKDRVIAAPLTHDRSVRSILEHPRGGPTVLRIVLGTQLRRLREASCITREEAGAAIRSSHAKISRLELGRVGFKERDVADLLTLYGVVEESEHEDFLSLARVANAPGWWHKFGDVLPSWFEMHIGLEEAASIIRCYEIQFIPGLLQTAAYARAVTRLGHPRATALEIDRRVDLRMRRQQLLTRPDAPMLWVIVDEAALRRPLGGPEVMNTQMEHLIEVSELPNVTLQIAPFHVGGLAAAGGPITILRFSDRCLPDIVYLEQMTSAIYLDKQEDVDNYLAVMDRLAVESEPRANTPDILRSIIADLDDQTDYTGPRALPGHGQLPL